MAKILVVDDHPMVRAGLRELLREERQGCEISEAGNSTEALQRLRESYWDLVILDINMPDRSGLELLKELRASYPQTKVLVLSAYPEHLYALNAIKSGASGYLPKECAPRDLLTAVQTVLQGRRYVSPHLSEILLECQKQGDQPPHDRLSGRELEVFHKLAAGCAVSNIARELCISMKTVSTYRTRILEKMNLKNNADITAYAVRNEIIQ